MIEQGFCSVEFYQLVLLAGACPGGSTHQHMVLLASVAHVWGGKEPNVSKWCYLNNLQASGTLQLPCSHTRDSQRRTGDLKLDWEG